MKNIIFILFSCFTLYSCYDIDKHLEKQDADQLPKVNLEPTNGILANGVDSIRIKVVFKDPPNPDLLKVNFTTREGVFIENNKSEYSSTRILRDIVTNEIFIHAYLKSTTKKGLHTVVVEMPDVFSFPLRVMFLSSFPETITTSKSKFAVERGFKDEIQLFANTKASKGLPHIGNPVEFVVADSLSSRDSRMFRGLTTTDEKGQASVYFTPGQFGGYTGKVTYKAITKNESGEEVIASGTFEIIEPEE